MITLLTPRYQHRSVSADEKHGRQIADVANADDPMPTRCADCGTTGSFRNPLMMKPHFQMEHGGPRGTLYQARCSDCQVKRVRRR